MHKSIKLKDRVITIKRQPSWRELIIALKVGENMVILEADAKYVRTEISSTIRFKYPDMQFITKKQVENGIDYLLISRNR